MISIDLQAVDSQYINWQALIDKALMGERISIKKAGREVANINPVQMDSSVITESSLEASSLNEEANIQNNSFDEVFGMLQSDKYVSIEEMNQAIRMRGAGL